MGAPLNSGLPAGWGSLLGRLTCAGVLLAAGLLKLSDLAAFARTVAALGIVPDALIPAVTLAVPVAEVGFALGILVPRVTGVALMGVMKLLVAFLIIQIVVKMRGGVVNCGCFGSLEILNWGFWPALLRNLVLLAIAATLYSNHVKRKTVAHE